MVRTNNKALTILFTLCLLLLSSVACAAPELTDEQERAADNLFSSLMSPFCPGRLISDCPSGKASDLKEEVRASLAAGKTIETVEKELYTRFGEKMLRPVPEEHGFGLLAWLLPGTFFLGGLLIVFKWLRTLNSGEAKVQAQNLPPIDSNLEERIKKDLNR